MEPAVEQSGSGASSGRQFFFCPTGLDGEGGKSFLSPFHVVGSGLRSLGNPRRSLVRGTAVLVKMHPGLGGVWWMASPSLSRLNLKTRKSQGEGGSARHAQLNLRRTGTNRSVDNVLTNWYAKNLREFART